MTLRASSRLAALRGRTQEMLGDLETLVDTESPSSDAASLERCANVLDTIGTRLIGSAEVLSSDDRTHLRWRWRDPEVLLLGHFDTVWPLDTVARWRFSVRDGRASGPGIFDMKAGIVQGLYALASLDNLEGIEVLLTSDEEISAPTSRVLIEDAARRTRAVLVLEPSADGALKLARKGGSLYRINVTGRAAHAGLEPEKGVNALLAIARVALETAELARPELGTTVTPTMVNAGTATNTVPGGATLHVDVRAASAAEQQRVDDGIRALEPALAGSRIVIGGGIDRPPLPRSASEELFERARNVSRDLGIGEIEGAEVGGSSDGNFTAAVGTPTLDGLGAIGDGAHAEGEWIEIDRMAERAALVAQLVDQLRR